MIGLLKKSIKENKFISNLSETLEKETSTRLFDWTDHFIVKASHEIKEKLLEKGFKEEEKRDTYTVYRHIKTLLPGVVVNEKNKEGVAVIVDSIQDFLMVRGLNAKIVGSPYSSYRRACVSEENGISLWAVERRGTRTMEPVYEDEGYLEKYFSCLEKWHKRPRSLEKEEENLDCAISLAKEVSKILNKDIAAYQFCETERKYWQAKNKAGQVQKSRQDRTGMGWANHDHHTFRSSRKNFQKLIRFFMELGFHCREKFYAGEQAGWGAQVMENSNAGFSLFLDVDLSPEELNIDFTAEKLEERENTGTIGLWCSLHGDSILDAGLHHLAGNFLFEDLTLELGKDEIKMMKPFSTFPYLKQAFTRGEKWKVKEERIKNLLKKGKISKETADKFLSTGAIGSHLENLQRREGFKGFNQENVSFIIKETDPRKNSE